MPPILDDLPAHSPLGFDAVHLAPALLLHVRLKATADGALLFAAVDRRLLGAAAKAELRVASLPPPRDPAGHGQPGGMRADRPATD